MGLGAYCRLHLSHWTLRIHHYPSGALLLVVPYETQERFSTGLSQSDVTINHPHFSLPTVLEEIVSVNFDARRRTCEILKSSHTLQCKIAKPHRLLSSLVNTAVNTACLKTRMTFQRFKTECLKQTKSVKRRSKSCANLTQRVKRLTSFPKDFLFAEKP